MEHLKLLEDLDESILYITNKITISEEIGISTSSACLRLQMALNRLESMSDQVYNHGGNPEVKIRLRELLFISKTLSVKWNSFDTCKLV